MALVHIDAGELRERLEVLELASDGAGGWTWKTARRTWAAAVLSAKKNVWSTYGIGATGVTFTVRRQPLRETNAFTWRGRHCFITSILPCGTNHWTVEAALVTVTQCEDRYGNRSFPGIVTEKYMGHEQQEPQAVNVMRRVLVTPKEVELQAGRLVHLEGTDWPITIAHTLDPNHNEYEIERTVDL